MRLTRLRKILWTCAGVGLAAWIGAIVVIDYRGHDAGEAASVGRPAIEPEFRLLSSERETVTEAAWPGKWLLVFFGFTNCPDICPTTLSDIAVVMDELGPAQDRVQPLFITVDPERDRAEDLARYVEAFHAGIVGLTGDASAIDAAATSFRAYYEKLEQEGAPDGYAMGHTTALYLINPEGAFVRTFSYGTPVEDIVRDLEARL